MINLKEYIITESIDNNLFWKIDKYFERNNIEKRQFYNIVDFCRDNPGFNHKILEEYLSKHNEFKNLKKFIDFLDDVVKQDTTNRNYVYILTIIIKQIIANKTEGNKYTNKKEN